MTHPPNFIEKMEVGRIHGTIFKHTKAEGGTLNIRMPGCLSVEAPV